MDQIYKPFVHGKKDLTIVDCGANVGLTAYYFKDFAKTVYAVEPSKQHIDCMKLMITQNKIENIEIMPCAVSKENGKAKFYHNENVTMFSLRQEVNNKAEFEEVETKTMEQIMKDLKLKHIDILKMDIEGSEYDVFTSKGFEAVADKIDCILGEFHTWSGINPNQFATCLMDLGYEFKWIKKTEATTFSAVR